MTDIEPHENDKADDSPANRAYQLLRIATSSVVAAALLAGITTSVTELWHRIYPEPQAKVWQVSNEDYRRIRGVVENSNADLANLEKVVANNPEALALVARLKTDLSTLNQTLNSVPYIETTVNAGLSLSLFTPANAAETSKGGDTGTLPAVFLYILLGIVVFVAVSFSFVFIFSKDKTKTAFAEKMITTIIGFALGMLTGSNTSRFK
ncbi:hypothetical protein ABIA24_000918 [Sinorhizobium fredii]|uniref:hypothetical protein n=1 Tax=Rhizobium fredii TaxID=380 RepID=UPI00351772C7